MAAQTGEHLTVQALSCNDESAMITRAVSGLRRDAERGFLVSGRFSEPECLHVVRHGAASCELSQHSGFLLPKTRRSQGGLIMTDKSFKTFCNGLALYVSRFLKEPELEGFRKKDDHQLLGYGMALDLLLRAGRLIPMPEEPKPTCKLIAFTPALQRKAERLKIKGMAREFYENN